MIKVNGVEFAVTNDILLSRPLNKKDLCALYKLSSVRSLNNMLHRKPLVHQLITIGYNPHKRGMLTKAQVEMIFQHLGVIRVEDLE